MNTMQTTTRVTRIAGGRETQVAVGQSVEKIADDVLGATLIDRRTLKLDLDVRRDAATGRSHIFVHDLDIDVSLVVARSVRIDGKVVERTIADQHKTLTHERSH